jgi:hypothetical protein
MDDPARADELGVSRGEILHDVVMTMMLKNPKNNVRRRERGFFEAAETTRGVFVPGSR